MSRPKNRTPEVVVGRRHNNEGTSVDVELKPSVDNFRSPPMSVSLSKLEIGSLFKANQTNMGGAYAINVVSIKQPQSPPNDYVALNKFPVNDRSDNLVC